MLHLLPITKVVGIVAALNVAIVLVFSITLSFTTLVRIAGAVDILLVLLSLWLWKLIWRYIPLLGELTFPNLEGVWEGELKYQAGADEAAKTKPVVARIKQSLLHLDMTLASDMSESTTLAMHISRDTASGHQQMFYTYVSEPFSANSMAVMHKGAASLTVRHVAKVLEGNYFNDQSRRGELRLTFVSRKMNEYDRRFDALKGL